MRRNAVGIVLVVAVAVAGVGVANASAAPEFLHLSAPVVGPNRNFEGNGVNSVAVLPSNGSRIECATVRLVAKILGRSQVTNAFVKGKGCVATVANTAGVVETCKVHTPGFMNGTIRTNMLVGELGEVAAFEATDERGLELQPKVGTVVTTIVGLCYPLAAIEGSIIGEITPKAVEQPTSELIYTQTGLSQTIQKFLAGPKHNLEIAGFEVVQTLKLNIAFKQPIEIT